MFARHCSTCVLLFLVLPTVSPFKCWMCPGGASTFGECDSFRTVEDCKQGTDSCGIFSYENTTGFRIYAKSCTYKNWCNDADEFCSNIRQGGRYCRIQCCHSELCNYVDKFRPTTPIDRTGVTEFLTTTAGPVEETCDFYETECNWINSGPTIRICWNLAITCAFLTLSLSELNKY